MYNVHAPNTLVTTTFSQHDVMYLFWSLVEQYKVSYHLWQCHRMLTHHFTECLVDVSGARLEGFPQECGEMMEVGGGH